MNKRKDYKMIAKIKSKIMAHKVISIIMLTAAVGGGYVAYQNYSDLQTVEQAFVPEFEGEQIKADVETGVTTGIEIPGYSEIIIDAGKTTAQVDFFNPENNGVYFAIQLMLTDTEEVIYESKLFGPGQHLYEIELMRALEEGEYNMTIIYSAYSMDETYTPRNGANMNCILKVV